MLLSFTKPSPEHIVITDISLGPYGFQSAFTQVILFDPQTGIRNNITIPVFPRNKVRLREAEFCPKSYIQ